MKKIKILCICITAVGIALFLTSCLLIPPASSVFRWSLGLSCALIILGLGYLINVLLILYGDQSGSRPDFLLREQFSSSVKEKSGYLVCKFMNILLCIYLLILSKLNSPPFVVLLGIILLLLQFTLDLILQIYFMRQKEREEE